MRLRSSKKKFLRSYALDLPQRLVRTTGRRDRFSPDEIEEVLRQWDMTSTWDYYAFALLLSEGEFLASSSAVTAVGSYWELRREMLSFLGLASDASTEDVVLASYGVNNPAAARAIGEARAMLWTVGASVVAFALYLAYLQWNAA